MTSDDRSRSADAHARHRLGAALATTLILAAAPALARDWYVDGKHGKYKNPGSYDQPFKSYDEADQVAQGGDTIYLLPTTTYPSLYIHASGTAGNPVVVAGAGAAPDLTKVSGGGTGFGIWIGGDHVTVRNFDATAPGPYSAIHSSQDHHHILITGNRAHDSGDNGISIVGDDYVTISYNEVYNNAHVTTGHVFASGISVKSSYNSDSYDGLKIRVNGNVVFANTNVPDCHSSSCWATASNSDGSGIIMDNNRRTEVDSVWYRGRTLISNNVVFGNGGRGIHMYLSDHISINGNTVFDNNKDTYEGNYRPGEVTGDYVSDISVYNNILTSDGGRGINNGQHTGTHVPISFAYCTTGSGEITVRNNLGWRPQNDPDSFLVSDRNTLPVVSYGNVWGEPALERRTLDRNLIDARVKRFSLAVNHGLVGHSLRQDALGVVRGATSTIGAFENAGP